MSDGPDERDEGEGGTGRAHGRDDPLERLRQFERERGLSESPVTSQPPEESQDKEGSAEADSSC